MKDQVNKDTLIKVLIDEASAEERHQVEKWLAESAENRKEYADFELIWKSSKAFSSIRSVDENEAWARFSQKLELKKAEQGNRLGHRKQIPFWMKIAASILLVGVGLWISYIIVFGPMHDSVFLSAQTHHETRVDTLSDGSIISLNKNSKLNYPRHFAKNNRTVKLEEGEVFFDIAPDASKPFIIEVNDVKVQVVGTSFNIKVLGKHTELIVETGIVEVSKNDIHMRLYQNERIKIDPSKNSFEKAHNTDQLYQYYRSKIFVADDTPLWRLVEVLNEAYDADIFIENKDLENLRLNTTFKDESLDAIVNIICQTLNIKADRKGKQIVLHL